MNTNYKERVLLLRAGFPGVLYSLAAGRVSRFQGKRISQGQSTASRRVLVVSILNI